MLCRGGVRSLATDMASLGDRASSDRIALQAHKLVALSPRIAAAERRLQTLEVISMMMDAVLCYTLAMLS